MTGGIHAPTGGNPLLEMAAWSDVSMLAVCSKWWELGALFTAPSTSRLPQGYGAHAESRSQKHARSGSLRRGPRPPLIEVRLTAERGFCPSFLVGDWISSLEHVRIKRTAVPALELAMLLAPAVRQTPSLL